MSMKLTRSLGLLILAAADPWEPMTEECGVHMLQTQVGAKTRQAKGARPWHSRNFIGAGWHRHGMFLNHELVSSVFLGLGAPISDIGMVEEPCYEGTCWNVEAPIRMFTAKLGLELLQKERQAAANGSRSLRVAGIMRNPLDMVASGYCYHHAGHELFDRVIDVPKIMTLDPVNGTAFFAQQLLPTVRRMSEVLQHPADDVHAVPFERLTESSESFDREVGKLLDFWFEDLSPEERTAAMQAAQTADGHRTSIRESRCGDIECVRLAREAVKEMPREVLEEYYSHQRKLGYPVG